MLPKIVIFTTQQLNAAIITTNQKKEQDDTPHMTASQNSDNIICGRKTGNIRFLLLILKVMGLIDLQKLSKVHRLSTLLTSGFSLALSYQGIQFFYNA